LPIRTHSLARPARELSGEDAYRREMPLESGDKAPAISLRDQHGAAVKLSQFKGQRVVLYFYPKADTPGCTTQSCALSEALPLMKKLRAVVIGVSPDPPEKQRKFDEKYSLGFPLLADTEHTVAEAYGVWGEKVNYGRKYMGIIRSAFVIDEKGKLAGVYFKVSPKDTVPKVTAALESLS
jgi:peroxiredoxin Q/BCP